MSVFSHEIVFSLDVSKFRGEWKVLSSYFKIMCENVFSIFKGFIFVVISPILLSF